ncbi:MAG: hypothetical protein AAB427_07035 [Chloroflexota bacterium]
MAVKSEIAMHTLADFFSQNIIVIYFLYGLAFFSMGLAGSFVYLLGLTLTLCL